MITVQFKIHVFQLLPEDTSEESFNKVTKVTNNLLQEIFQVAESLAKEQKNTLLLNINKQKKYLYSLDANSDKLSDVKFEAKQHVSKHRLVFITDNLGNIHHIYQ